MSVDLRALRSHALLAAAVAMGIVGMGIVCGGAMDGNMREMSRGVPLLLIGLWWAGRELGRSVRAQRVVDASIGGNSSTIGVTPRKEQTRDRC